MDHFKDFELLRWVGVFRWDGSLAACGPSTKLFADTHSKEICAGIEAVSISSNDVDQEANPQILRDSDFPRLQPLQSLTAQLPLLFRDPQSLNSAGATFSNQFPNDPGYVVPLYVAVRYFGIHLNDIDFVLGGSVLTPLAQRKIQDRDLQEGTSYVVQNLPSIGAENHNITFVAKSKVQCFTAI